MTRSPAVKKPATEALQQWTKWSKPSSTGGGMSLPLGAHPLNTGGKKGRSGPKKVDFVAWCRQLTDDELARQAYEERNRAGDLPVMEFAAKYAHGKPPEMVAHVGEVVIRIAYDD